MKAASYGKSDSRVAFLVSCFLWAFRCFQMLPNIFNCSQKISNAQTACQAVYDRMHGTSWKAADPMQMDPMHIARSVDIRNLVATLREWVIRTTGPRNRKRKREKQIGELVQTLEFSNYLSGVWRATVSVRRSNRSESAVLNTPH